MNSEERAYKAVIRDRPEKRAGFQPLAFTEGQLKAEIAIFGHINTATTVRGPGNVLEEEVRGLCACPGCPCAMARQDVIGTHW